MRKCQITATIISNLTIKELETLLAEALTGADVSAAAFNSKVLKLTTEEKKLNK